MKSSLVDPSTDMGTIESVAMVAFSSTPDASLDEWLSFSYMKQMIIEGRGYALKALDESGEVTGMIYAQQESPINGKEGEEKWVIIIVGVVPKFTGKGVGSLLLNDLEKLAKSKKIAKLFTFTNKDDDAVINFYQKNGYEAAGWVKDYQYGSSNSAVFLLKHLS